MPNGYRNKDERCGEKLKDIKEGPINEARTSEPVVAEIDQSKDWNKLLLMTQLIQNPELRDYTRNFLETETPEYFKEIPASSTGKYHPKYALGKGGLIRHTIAAVYFGYEISKLEYLCFTQADRDKILCALFLHDTFKQGDGTAAGNTVADHAKIAADKVAPKDGYIAGLMLSHMGQWGYNKPGGLKQFVVHLADYLASRKPLGVDFELV